MLKMMMTVMALAIVSAHAQLPTINLENFKASYNSPEGSGSADKININGHYSGDQVDFDIFQQAGELVLQSSQDEFSFGGLPSIVYDWKSLNIEKIDLKVNESEIDLMSQMVNFTTHTGYEGQVSGVQLNCKKQNKKGPIDSALDLCINNVMDAYVPFIKGININNINIWTKGNELTFSLKNTVWIKGQGKAWYLPEENQIKLRIDKAKTGFINITGKFFNEIKAMENEFIKVDRPWVTIDMPSMI